MTDHAITFRQIIKEAITKAVLEKYPVAEVADEALNKIKQKLAHCRRTIGHEIDTNRQNSNAFITTDQILDIFYNELDNFCEGLDYDKKDLNQMSIDIPEEMKDLR